ncbi:MAG: helix-turn-helix transcriptional regulator [Methylococcales bacterium]|nr:helix-turn-helix transcriptional regulator [Methylococcales bacterium]
MKINNKVRFLRKEHGWTQEYMAEKLSMTPNSYSNLERGVTDIRNSHLERIAKIFGIDLLDLYNFGEQVNNSRMEDKQAIQKLIFSQEATSSELQKMQQLIQEQNKAIFYLKELLS